MLEKVEDKPVDQTMYGEMSCQVDGNVMNETEIHDA